MRLHTCSEGDGMERNKDKEKFIKKDGIVYRKVPIEKTLKKINASEGSD